MAEVLFTEWCKGYGNYCADTSVHTYTGTRFPVQMVLLTDLYSLSGNDSCKIFLVIKHALKQKIGMSPSWDITTGTSQCAGGRKCTFFFPLCKLWITKKLVCTVALRWQIPYGASRAGSSFQTRCCPETRRGFFRPQKGNTVSAGIFTGFNMLRSGQEPRFHSLMVKNHTAMRVTLFKGKTVGFIYQEEKWSHRQFSSCKILLSLGY